MQLEELQVQLEELQAQLEELQAQLEELQAQLEMLQVQLPGVQELQEELLRNNAVEIAEDSSCFQVAIQIPKRN